MASKFLGKIATLSRCDKTMSRLGGKIDKKELTEYLEKKHMGGMKKTFARQGYLFLMEKKPLGSSWVKHYCIYEKANRKFIMIAYNPISGKIIDTNEIILKSGTRRISESTDEKFCFDLIADDRSGIIFTMQALSEEDRRLWLEAMNGLEPTCGPPLQITKPNEIILDSVGFKFIQECIEELETRGLEDHGLYRLVLADLKVMKLLQQGLDPRKSKKLALSDQDEWETNTITSAVKTFFRNLPQPLMTFGHREAFFAAAKQERRVQMISDIHALVHQLPPDNFRILEKLVLHLQKVAAKADINKMTIANLAVCFGPILFRMDYETNAAVNDIKLCNIIVEILIENADLQTTILVSGKKNLSAATTVIC